MRLNNHQKRLASHLAGALWKLGTIFSRMVPLASLCQSISRPFIPVTGLFADKPIRCQSSRGQVNLRTSQLAETFDSKFTV